MWHHLHLLCGVLIPAIFLPFRRRRPTPVRFPLCPFPFLPPRFRLAESAEISLQIGYSPIGENVQPPEGQLRPLTQVPESVRKEIWDEATRKAEEAGKKVTAKAVSEAVEEWKQRS